MFSFISDITELACVILEPKLKVDLANCFLASEANGNLEI